MNYPNWRYRSSKQLFRKFALFRTARLILCEETLIKMFRSRQFTTVVELEKQSMTFYPWNPKWKEVCVNKCQFNSRQFVNKALIAFGLWPVFWNSTCRFVLTACLWMSIGSWIAHHRCLLSGCFFLLETLLVILTPWPKLWFSQYMIASHFDTPIVFCRFAFGETWKLVFQFKYK